MTLAKALAADVCLDVGEFALSCEALLLGEEQDTKLFRIFDGLLWDPSPYAEPGGSPQRPAAPPPGSASDTASPKPRQSRRGRMNRPSEANHLTAASPHRRQRPTAPPTVSSPLLIRPPPLGSGRNSPTSPTSPPSSSPRLQARRASTGRTRRGSLGAILPPCEEDLLRLKLRRVVRLLFGAEALGPLTPRSLPRLALPLRPRSAPSFARAACPRGRSSTRGPTTSRRRSDGWCSARSASPGGAPPRAASRLRSTRARLATSQLATPSRDSCSRRSTARRARSRTAGSRRRTRQVLSSPGPAHPRRTRRDHPSDGAAPVRAALSLATSGHVADPLEAALIHPQQRAELGAWLMHAAAAERLVGLGRIDRPSSDRRGKDAGVREVERARLLSLLSERSPSELLTLLYFSALQSASLRERGIGLPQAHMASRQLLVVCKRLWATELRRGDDGEMPVDELRRHVDTFHRMLVDAGEYIVEAHVDERDAHR